MKHTLVIVCVPISRYCGENVVEKKIENIPEVD